MDKLETIKKIKELETKGDVKGLKKVKEEANASFEINIAAIAEKAITRLNNDVKLVETTTPAETAQIEGMGGSVDEITKRTEGVDKKIDAVEAETERKIKEVSEGGKSIAETRTETKEVELKLPEGMGFSNRTRELMDPYRLDVVKKGASDPNAPMHENMAAELKKREELFGQERARVEVALSKMPLDKRNKFIQGYIAINAQIKDAEFERSNTDPTEYDSQTRENKVSSQYDKIKVLEQKRSEMEDSLL